MKSSETKFCLSRRNLLVGLSAIYASRLAGKEQNRSDMPGANRESRRIDLHHHFLPPEYVRLVGKETIGAPAPAGKTPEWNIQNSLATMNQFGIRKAIVSISTPGVYLKHVKTPRNLARMCNEYAAGMKADHGKRFGFFAVLPMPAIGDSLLEIDHAYDYLACEGIGLFTNYDGLYLGDSMFMPVLNALNERSAVVFVHPTKCRCTTNAIPGVPDASIEFPHETTRAITSLLFSGAFSKFNKIRFVFSHAGGTVPFIAQRLAITAALDRRLSERVPEGVMNVLKRLYYDTAISSNPVTLGALLQLVTAKQIVFGTDFPFLPQAYVGAVLRDVDATILNAADRSAIEWGNANALIGDEMAPL